MKHSGTDLLMWPNIELHQFHELLPALAQLELSLRDRVMIEGLGINYF